MIAISLVKALYSLGKANVASATKTNKTVSQTKELSKK